MFVKESIRRIRRATISFQEILHELDLRLQGGWAFSQGRVLGSMCSDPHPLAKQVFTRYLELNAGDPGLKPGLMCLEKEVVETLGSWWGHKQAVGSLVSGGTEANLLALWTAKKASKKGQNQVILSQDAHFSFDKAASIMGLELIKIPVDRLGRIVLEKVYKAINKRTLALVGLAGSTSLGAVDDLAALAECALGANLYFHVDACFGGFVLPFLQEAGFSSPDFLWKQGYSSLALDPHKMGRAPIPSGCLIWKDTTLAERCKMQVAYLSGGNSFLQTFLGSRSGAAIAAVWALVKHLGQSGYTDIVRKAMETTYDLVSHVQKMASVEVVLSEPVTNIVAIRPQKKSALLVCQILREQGWALSVWKDFLRVVLMPHVEQEKLRYFLEDLQKAIE